jgi:hypothetical protein
VGFRPTFAVGATLRLRALAVFSPAMLGLLVGGAIGGAAAAPLARLVLDARDVVREDCEHQARVGSEGAVVAPLR